MKNSIMAIFLVVSTTVLMSFAPNDYQHDINLNTFPEEIENITSNYDCWWDETFKRNFVAKRDAACGSRTSLKIWYTNPYTFKVRVAFYLRDTDGNLNDYAPHVIGVKPGRTVYHHICRSNGRYTILAARADDYCTFPKIN